jgi:methylmalonyl-CoA mutase C-terminal domain/subunit
MTPTEVAATALQEDVDVVGLSILAPHYMMLVSETLKELKKQGKGEVLVLLGGAIYKEDIPALKNAGISEVFLPGTPLKDIVEFVHNQFHDRSHS